MFCPIFAAGPSRMWPGPPPAALAAGLLPARPGHARGRAGPVGAGRLRRDVLTVDTPHVATRPRDLGSSFTLPDDVRAVNLPQTLMGTAHTATTGRSAIQQHSRERHDQAITWADLAWLRARTSLPLLLKGVLTGEDARLAAEHGVDGLVVPTTAAGSWTPRCRAWPRCPRWSPPCRSRCRCWSTVAPAAAGRVRGARARRPGGADRPSGAVGPGRRRPAGRVRGAPGRCATSWRMHAAVRPPADRRHRPGRSRDRADRLALTRAGAPARCPQWTHWTQWAGAPSGQLSRRSAPCRR